MNHPTRGSVPYVLLRKTSCVVALVLALGGFGCAHSEKTDKLYNSAPLLVTAEPELGSVYELSVYVITGGDTLSNIAERFRVTREELQTLNPGMRPNALRIGQRIRLHERRKSQTEPVLPPGKP